MPGLFDLLTEKKSTEERAVEIQSNLLEYYQLLKECRIKAHNTLNNECDIVEMNLYNGKINILCKCSDCNGYKWDEQYLISPAALILKDKERISNEISEQLRFRTEHMRNKE